MSMNPDSPITKADLEAFEQRILQQLDRISGLVQLDQVRRSLRLADRINAATPTAYGEGDVERIIDEVRTELDEERTALRDRR